MVFGTRKSSWKPLLTDWVPFKLMVSRASFKRLESWLASMSRNCYPWADVSRITESLSNASLFSCLIKFKDRLFQHDITGEVLKDPIIKKKKIQEEFFSFWLGEIFSIIWGDGRNLFLLSCFVRNILMVSGGRCLLCWMYLITGPSKEAFVSISSSWWLLL